MKHKKLKSYAISAVAAIAVTAFNGCAQKGDAKSIVKTFMKENMSDYDISKEEFSKPDSTSYVTGNAITLMRQEATKMNTFKKDIRYADAPKGKKLAFITMSYSLKDGTKQSQTFYINSDAMAVVAFKNNRTE